MVSRTESNKPPRITSKKALLFTISLGICVLIPPLIFIFLDPISSIAKYKLRLDNGSMLHDLLLTRIEGPKIYMYIFNITNAEDFISGKDEKIKVKEIGPFVYQEYRTMRDLEINQDPGIMSYTPKLETVFIPEESLCHPKDINLTMSNIPMLAAAALISKYPYLVRQLLNVIATSTNSKAFTTMSVYDYLWGYPDPLINLANTVVPGLIYFKSVGLMERLYDFDVDYRLELGTANANKFKIKSVKKSQSSEKGSAGNVFLNTQFFNDTYEGAGFPPDLKPDIPIHIYRHSICKTFQIQHVGSRAMGYGGQGFVYNSHNSTFNDQQLCDSAGWCPHGVKDMAPCYFDLPFGLTKGHFLDSDPRLLDKVEGLTPTRELHDIEIVIYPKIGVTITGSISLQLNLFLADVSFSPQAKTLKDTVLPVSHVILRHPNMVEEVRSSLRLMYTEGPKILIFIQIICLLLGLLLLAHSFRTVYWSWKVKKTETRADSKFRERLRKADKPLLLK